MSDTSPGGLARPGAAAAGPRQTIDFDDVSIHRGERLVIDRVSLNLTERRIGIVGLNGSGKSTLLRAIIGLVAPSSGAITVDGRDSVGDARAIRRATGLLFQNPDNQIVFPIVAEDLAFGLKNHGWPKDEVAGRVASALDRLGIGMLATRRIHELSGGEKQLVALAGVLAPAPATVLFDEPTSQLDLRNRNRLRDVLHALPEQAIVVAHDLDLVADFDRVIVVDGGRVIRDGAPIDTLGFYRETFR